VNNLKDIIEINNGLEISPKLMKFRKNMPVEERRHIDDLINQYRNVFAYTYNELKSYKGDIIQERCTSI